MSYNISVEINKTKLALNEQRLDQKINNAIL